MLILLTGGSGMVGRNLLEHPSSQSHELIAPTSTELDLCDLQATKDYLNKLRPDFVVHAAGKVGGIQANICEPVEFLTKNLSIGTNIVIASRACGIKRLINLGSSCMYPRNHDEPLTEDLILHGELEPTNEGYALAKIITMKLAQYVAYEDSSISYKTIIPCNLYGRFDKFDLKHSHLIPAAIHKVHQAMNCGNENVEIWGNGKARREFMYAGDLVDGLWHAIDRFEEIPSVMNIGLGYDFSIDEYYDMVAEVLGYSGTFLHNLNKPVGMSRKLLSIDRQCAWGWEASNTLRQGIKKTYDYYLKEMHS